MSIPKIQITTVGLDEITGYAHNPRDNAAAVDSVAASIEQFGFLVPIVVDANMVIAAGHTRYAAATKLGLEEVPIVIADHLTEKQIAAFRLIDNKVSELATWDMDLLSKEIAALEDQGLDLTSFGWSQEEIDCLSSMADMDCLTESSGDEAPAPALAGPLALAPNAAAVSAAVATRREASVYATPQTVGIRIGEVNIFAAIVVFETWLAEARQEVEFDQTRLTDLLCERLGLNAVAARMRAEGKFGEGPAGGTSPSAVTPKAPANAS